MIRGIAFDKDGTLIDSERIYKLAISAAAEKLHITIEDKFFADILGKSEEYSGNRLAALTTDPNAFFAEILKQRNLLINDQMPFMTGAEDLLREISQKYPLALVTSDNKKRTIKGLREFLPLFKTVVTADDVQNVKPNPEPYLTAVIQLNVAPHELLVIEDSDVGVAAGHAAGAKVLQVGRDIQTLQDIWHFV